MYVMECQMSHKVKKKKRSNNMHKNLLLQEAIKVLYELAEDGHKLTQEEKYMEAIQVWTKAIELMPETRQGISMKRKLKLSYDENVYKGNGLYE